jgi:hypothetical protein
LLLLLLVVGSIGLYRYRQQHYQLLLLPAVAGTVLHPSHLRVL